MLEPERSGETSTEAVPRVFISYATSDRKRALTITRAIEQRGIPCWISTRDVAPGENYQEAIVRAIRTAPAMVLVFSSSANDSDEIKKELSLASRHRIPVLTLRSEDVEPSDAFAYELSTRQWIDAFGDADNAIDTLVGRLTELMDMSPAPSQAGKTAEIRNAPSLRRRSIACGGAVFLLLGAVAGWVLLRPSRTVAHAMSVRLAGFDLLSGNLPATMHEAVDAEISAAFNADGVIGVSTASAPIPGSVPAYAIGGTIHRIGSVVRVITELRNERSGSVLWSDSVDYPADQLAKIPHKIAVDAGIVVRCGLSDAATYRKPLPDGVFKDYMQYCQHSWDYGGTKTLLPAQRVVAALPDFSWGWSAVQTGFMQAAQEETDERRARELRASGLEAAEKALALDPRNSEALDRKTYLIDRRAWSTKEALYKASIAAKPLDCGCEHYGYGLMLAQVGRLKDAVEQQTAATTMLALWPDSQFALAQVLLATGRAKEAQEHFESAIELSKDPNTAQWIAVIEGMDTGDYAPAIAALKDSRFQIGSKTALLTAYEALKAGDPQQKAKAIQVLLALPKAEQRESVPALVAALGNAHDALRIAGDKPWLFWRPSMRSVLYDSAFPGVAKQLRLLQYWRQSGRKPDICAENAAPPFCRMI